MSSVSTVPTTTPAARSSESALLPGTFRLQLVETAAATLARIAGPMDLESAPAVRERLLSLPSEGRRLVVDLTRADYVDSEGVRALLAVQQAAEAARGELRVVARPGSRAERTLLLLLLNERLALCATVGEALRGTGEW